MHDDFPNSSLRRSSSHDLHMLDVVDCGDESEFGHRLANLPLQEGIDWSVFKGLDFDAMAGRRRARGRRPS
jgi:hypothetical protein